MPNLFDKNNREIIETMNTHMGTNHRNKPYDLNNPEDLKHALLMAAAAYGDYRQYVNVLFMLIEDFDESLENYDTISWFNLGRATGEVDKLAMDCVKAVHSAADKFEKITVRAREDFVKTLKIVLSLPVEKQIAVLGKAYSIKPEEMDNKIDLLIEIFDEEKYQYKIPDTFDMLLKIMAEMDWQ